MLQDGKEKRTEIDSLFYELSSRQLKEFLSIEMKYDNNLQTRFTDYFKRGSNAPKRDYKSDINLLYKRAISRYGMIEYGNELDFERFISAARTKEGKKDYAGAARIYQELSEAIAENMDTVDDSDGYYGDCFIDAIDNMTSCINQQVITHEQKQQYISYMFERYIRNDPDYFVEHYVLALEQICKNRQEYTFWRDLLEPHVPKKMPNSRNWHKHYNAREMIQMKIYILGKLKDRSIEDTFATHYRDDSYMCIQYIRYLQKTDSKRALQVMQEGLGLYPESTEIKDIACKIYKKTDPRHHNILMGLYLDTLETRYYSALKKISPKWGNTVKVITRHLARTESYDTLIDTYLKEGMYSNAIRQVVSCDDLSMLARYRKDLAARYPKEYHNSYKRLLAEFAESRAGRNHYKKVGTHLREFSTIPGYKREFREIVNSLKRQYSTRPAFLDEIKGI